MGATTSGRWDKRGAGGRRAAGVAAGLAVLAGGAVLGLGGGAAARAGVPAGAAGSDARPWLAVESSVFGPAASTTWRGVRASDQELGGVAREAGEGGRGDTGRKVKAGLLSLILPGAGQFYNGDQQKAYIFAGVEAAVWASYLTFDVMGDHRAEDYREYAGIYADAGPSGSDQYWRAVGRYMDSDAYNESILREARSYGVEPAGLIGPEGAWQWRNETHQQVYQGLRADAARAYDRRDFTAVFAVINRVVAVYDAIRHSVDDRLTGDVLGFRVRMEVSPSLQNPRTGCVISRSF